MQPAEGVSRKKKRQKMRREKAAQKRKATKTAAEVIPVDNTENLVPPQVASYASRRKREHKEKQKLKKRLKALGVQEKA